MNKKYILNLILLLFSVVLFAQNQPVKRVDWTKMGNNPNATFYEIVNDFNNYWENKKREKGKGYKPFKRWEAHIAPRVFPTGNMTLTQNTYQNFLDWQKNQKNNSAANRSNNSQTATGNWTELGPIGSPSGPVPYSGTGAGRLNFLRFDPTNSNTMFVGAADGGLWKSINNGTTWTTNTDFLTIIGCSDLCINPLDTQIMYLATGDLEGSRNSIGVLKTTDGGMSWNTTGLAFAASDYTKISKMLIDPTDPSTLIAATNNGIYKTVDGGTNWTLTQSFGQFFDMEFKPGDSNIVYASGTDIYKSIDKGTTWTQVTSGTPTSGVYRIALGVTIANPNYVYALIANDSNYGFYGLYRSADSGTSFSSRSTTPNLLGYETDGSDTGGQGFYDLSIAVSPTDAEKIISGGVNHWQSNDGGSTWTNLSYWASGQVHADVHDALYSPDGSTLYSCNDGGIFKTNNGTNWTDISNNLAISQLVGMGLSENDESKIVIGTQDNGTNLKSGTSWSNILGGDGGECFLDPTDNNIVYTQYVYGSFTRQTISPETVTDIVTGLPTPLYQFFDFYSAWKMDPINHNKLYAGGSNHLYISTNQGDNWEAAATPFGSGNIKGIAIAPNNPNKIYCIKQDAISVSSNSGTSFTNITGTLPVGSAALSNITVSNTDANKVWVTFSGYSAGNKVFKTIDGGATWTNISSGLPNLPMNTIVYHNNSINDAVYVGGDIGVYYLDNTLTSFAGYMTNLPNTNISDLEIYYPTLKLRAATYGRGVWESPLNLITNNITATTGANGTITPNGNTTVVSGGNQTYTITPNACYSINSVLVDGVNNPTAVSSGTYTFSNVTAAHTIVATFISTAPAAPIGTTLQTFCSGETIGSIVATGTGIIWYDAATGGTVLPNSTIIVSGTTYYASQTVSGCESTARLAVTMATGSCLATNEFDNASFNYYPNPVNNILKMSYSKEISKIKITNILGQHLFSKTINATETQVDMSNLAQGTYFVEVIAGDVSKTIKVIKK